MKHFVIEGLIGDAEKMNLYETRFIVSVIDGLGYKTLSIGDEKSGVQMIIPVAASLLEALKGGAA